MGIKELSVATLLLASGAVLAGDENSLQEFSAPSSYGWPTPISKRLGNGLLITSAGAVRGDGTMLRRGVRQTSESSTDEMRFLSVGGAYALRPRTSLLAQLAAGMRFGKLGNGAGLVPAAEAPTASWSVGLVRGDAWTTGDRLGLSVSQPMRFRSGGLSLTLPNAEELGQLQPVPFNVLGAMPPRAETDFALGYAMPLARYSKLRFNAVYKLNANSDMGSAAIIATRYQAAF